MSNESFQVSKKFDNARIKRLTVTTSKTAIAVLSAVILTLVVAVCLSKSVRFFCREHPGIFFVVIAVAGEVICDWNRKKTLKERLKKFFGVLLVAGLLLEIVEAVKSDKETASAENEAAQAQKDAGTANERASSNELAVQFLISTNLVLRTNLLALNLELTELDQSYAGLVAGLQQKTLTPTEQQKFIESLKNAPRGPIMVVFPSDFRFPSIRLIYYARISEMLLQAGYNITNSSTLKQPPDKPDWLMPKTDIAICINNSRHRPVLADYLDKAFSEIPMKTQIIGMDYAAAPFNLETNEVLIYVVSPSYKPFF